MVSGDQCKRTVAPKYTIKSTRYTTTGTMVYQHTQDKYSWLKEIAETRFKSKITLFTSIRNAEEKTEMDEYFVLLERMVKRRE